MQILRSALLDAFPHGFTTRRGGVSPAPWDSLNLGGAVGDEPQRVSENWRLLEAATGLSFARVRQVHGARVVTAEAPSAPGEEADAVVSIRPGVARLRLGGRLRAGADRRSGERARSRRSHAGWRGTLARAAAEGVRALAREAGAPPERLLAAIGPSIGPCCYQVSAGAGGAVPGRARAAVVRGDGVAPRLDLWAANRRVLEDAGPASRADRRSWAAAPRASANSSSPTGATPGGPVGRWRSSPHRSRPRRPAFLDEKPNSPRIFRILGTSRAIGARGAPPPRLRRDGGLAPGARGACAARLPRLRPRERGQLSRRVDELSERRRVAPPRPARRTAGARPASRSAPRRSRPRLPVAPPSPPPIVPPDSRS